MGGEDFCSWSQGPGQVCAEVQNVVKPRGGVHVGANKAHRELNLKISVMNELASIQNPALMIISPSTKIAAEFLLPDFRK